MAAIADGEIRKRGGKPWGTGRKGRRGEGDAGSGIGTVEWNDQGCPLLGWVGVSRVSFLFDNQGDILKRFLALITLHSLHISAGEAGGQVLLSNLRARKRGKRGGRGNHWGGTAASRVGRGMHG